MRAGAIGACKLWEHVGVAQQEVYVLTHGVHGHIPGSYVTVIKWVKARFYNLLQHARSFLKVQALDWAHRKGFDAESAVFTDQVLSASLDTMLRHATQHARVPGEDGLYYMPRVAISLDGRRVHKTLMCPVVVVQFELSPQHGKPRVSSAHTSMPLRPAVVVAASDCLSLSISPGRGRLLAHLPMADNLADEETVAAAAILLSRTSAMADLAVTDVSTMSSSMLRHGAHMQRLKANVGRTASRHVFRHVAFERVADVAPPLVHPLGPMDGGAGVGGAGVGGAGA